MQHRNVADEERDILDRNRVVEVARRGHLDQQQAVTHQWCHGPAVPSVEAEPPSDVLATTAPVSL